MGGGLGGGGGSATERARAARLHLLDRLVRGGARRLELEAHRAARVALVRVRVPVRPGDPPGHGDGPALPDRLRRGVHGDAGGPLDLQRQVLVIGVVGVAGQVDPCGGLPGSGVLVPEVDVPGLDVQPFVEVADALRLVHHLAVTAVDGVPQLVPGVGLAPVGEHRRSGVVLQLGRHPEGHVHLDLLLDPDHDRLPAVHRDPGEGDPALRRAGRHRRHRCEHGRRSTGHRRPPHRLPHPLEPALSPCGQDRARVGAPARG